MVENGNPGKRLGKGVPRLPKRTRDQIDARLTRAAEDNSIHSQSYVPFELNLVTSFAQRMAEKMFYGRSVRGFHTIDVVLRLVSQNSTLIDELVEGLKEDVKTLLEFTRKTKDDVAAEVKKVSAPKIQTSHPHTAEYKATTSMALKYLQSVQNFDDTVINLQRLMMADVITGKEMVERVNQVSGEIAKLSIKIIQISRRAYDIGSKTEGVDTKLLGDKDEDPLPAVPGVAGGAGGEGGAAVEETATTTAQRRRPPAKAAAE